MKAHPKTPRWARIERPTKPLSRGRLWLFRITALLLPLALFGSLEIGLRLAGYGYSTSFFRKIRMDGQEFLVNNDTFSLRFFPPELARWPGTLKVPAAETAGHGAHFHFR